jgi:uncharacterized protein YbcV (DUF1398 family)
MGVDRIETNVLTCQIKYVGEGASLIEPPPEGFMPLTAATTFDVPRLKNACQQYETRAIDYVRFMSELAAAGVAFYRVDMRPRTVTYHGPTPKDKYVENILQS